MHDALDVPHLRRAAHRRGVPLADALHLVAKVEVRVDLQHGDRAASLEGAQDRDRHGVVPTDADRHDSTLENRGYDLGDPGAVARTVIGVAGHVAGIHAIPKSHRPIEVEVPVVAEAGEPHGAAADGGWGQGAARGGTGPRIGPPVRNAEDRDLGVQSRRIGLDREAKEARLR